MLEVKKTEQLAVNGGGHSHWMCSSHGYPSVARTLSSANAWTRWHNDTYHARKSVAKVTHKNTCTQTTGKCKTIYQDRPKGY